MLKQKEPKTGDLMIGSSINDVWILKQQHILAVSQNQTCLSLLENPTLACSCVWNIVGG